MFSTVRYFIKTSIIFLITGILTGVYMSVSKNIFSTGYTPEIVTAHVHVILIGSVMMMIMGVALWFFPRAVKDDRKYNPGLILAVYWIMTVSTSLRYLSEMISSYYFSYWINVSTTLFSLFQVAGIILFFYSIWGRIRPVGSHIREAKGEKF